MWKFSRDLYLKAVYFFKLNTLIVSLTHRFFSKIKVLLSSKSVAYMVFHQLDSMATINLGTQNDASTNSHLSKITYSVNGVSFVFHSQSLNRESLLPAVIETRKFCVMVKIRR